MSIGVAFHASVKCCENDWNIVSDMQLPQAKPIQKSSPSPGKALRALRMASCASPWRPSACKHAGQNGFVAISQRRLCADPARLHGLLRPNHRFRRAQRRFRHFIISLASAQTHIPPDLETLRLKAFREQLRAGLIFAIVGKEDIGHRACMTMRSGIARALHSLSVVIAGKPSAIASAMQVRSPKPQPRAFVAA